MLSGCNNSTRDIVVTETPRPPLVVQEPDVINTREVSWTIITPDNYEEVFDSLPPGTALFAVTAEGYSNLATNLADIRALVEQQQLIILAYRQYYE
jgi:hypothetical protein